MKNSLLTWKGSIFIVFIQKSGQVKLRFIYVAQTASQYFKCVKATHVYYWIIIESFF